MPQVNNLNDEIIFIHCHSRERSSYRTFAVAPGIHFMEINFKSFLKGKVVIVGIGHPLRGDDALGPSLVKRLEGHLDALCIDAGSAPENYLGKIIKAAPDVVLFIDAVDLNKEPGFYQILEQEEILKAGFTTHDLSPRMLIEYLTKETKARIYLLGIQPKDIELGQGLSAPVQKALSKLELSICFPPPCGEG